MMTPPPTPSILPTSPAKPPTGTPRSDCVKVMGSTCPQKVRFKNFRPILFFKLMLVFEAMTSRENEDSAAANSSSKMKAGFVDGLIFVQKWMQKGPESRCH